MVAPQSKLAVRSLSISMVPALKSERRPRKNKRTKWPLSFEIFPPKKLNFINFLLKLIVQKV